MTNEEILNSCINDYIREERKTNLFSHFDSSKPVSIPTEVYGKAMDLARAEERERVRVVMNEEEFCKFYTVFYGEEVSDLTQITGDILDGEELLEFANGILKSKQSNK